MSALQKEKKMPDIFYYDTNSVDIRRDKAIKYYRMARKLADEFSKDPSTKCGCIFLAPVTHRVLTMGYNGMPRGIDETIPERWERSLKYDLTEHSERNAIYNAASLGFPLKDSICVVTMFPCCDCARAIIQVGCKMLVTIKLEDSGPPDRIKRWSGKWKTSLLMLKEANINIMFLSNDELHK